MEYFNRLGDRTRQLWGRHDFDEQFFPDVCLQVLKETPPVDHVDPIGLLSHFLRTGPWPTQPPIPFGQPPIVVFRDRHFYIEVLYWMDGTTALHQHSFSGAFHVLGGSSLQGLYHFTPESRVSSRLLLGPIEVERVELLRTGSTRPIQAGRQLIHSLFHLQRPSVTVVIRTQREPDHLPQFSYLRPWVAFDQEALEKDDLLARSGQVLALLDKVQPDKADAALEQWMLERDLTSTFGLLSQVAGSNVDMFERFRERTELRAQVELRHLGFNKVWAACEELQWQTNIITRRSDVIDADHRYFLALLLNVPRRTDILRLAGEWSGGDPVETVLRWTSELTQKTPTGSLDLLGIEVEPPTRDFDGQVDVVLQTTLRSLIEGHPEATLPRLRERYSAAAIKRQAAGVKALQAALSTSLFRPVVTPG